MSALRSTSVRGTRWAYLGRLGYGEATALQARLARALQRGEGEEHLLLLEHPPVFTLGRNASAGDVLAPREWLAARGIEVWESDRGGQVTYHGPGQLVGYPILDLNPDRRDVRRYVADLCAALIETLAEFGIAARPGGSAAATGVWVGEEKIASVGIHLARWVTTHGFALNVATDLEHFSGIVACGMPQVRLTSIERLTGARPSLAEVARRFVPHFAAALAREMSETAAAELLGLCPSAS